jgi:hypothetical protein
VAADIYRDRRLACKYREADRRAAVRLAHAVRSISAASSAQSCRADATTSASIWKEAKAVSNASFATARSAAGTSATA